MSVNSVSSSDSTSKDVDAGLLDVVRLFRDNKLVIGVVAVCGGLAAAVVSYLSEPVYRVDALVMSVSTDGVGQPGAMSSGLAGIAALAGVRVDGQGSNREEAIATLKSRNFIEEFVRDEQLLPILFHKSWDEQHGRWDVENPEDAPTLFDGYKRFKKDVLTVDEDSRSGLITVSVAWSDPEQAATWAGLLIDRVNLKMRERAQSDARKSIDYITNEMKSTSTVAVEQSLYQLLESYLKTIVLANVRDEYVFRIIDPPAPPSHGDYVWPRSKEMILAGIVFGLMLGVFISFVMGLRRKLQASEDE